MKKVIISSLESYKRIEENLDFAVFCPISDRQRIINCAINTRELTKNMVRCKSSNIWAYAMNIRDRHDKTGDLVMQFKGKNGGADPNSVYIYYDVPIKVYNKLVSAPSKGHTFWKLIRNKYKYSKLGGDKRGKLSNAIN